MPLANIKISVITVCLNAQATIRRTIESVLGQGYPNLEYIIIDGLSTDSTMEIIAEYGKEIAILRSEKDRGISDAFNKGIALATGQLVGILNADDYYLPGALKAMADAYRPNTILHGDLLVPRATGKGFRVKVSSDKAYLSLAKGQMGSIFHPTVFLPKSIYDKEGGFLLNYRNAMDYELMARLHVCGYSFRYVKSTITYMDPFGISERTYGRSIKESLRAFHHHFPRAPYVYTVKVYLKLLKNVARKIIEAIFGARAIEVFRSSRKSRYA